MRYTKKQLDSDLDSLNNRLAKYNLRAQSRNGYVGLDLYNKGGGCLRTIECGTARECLAAASQFVLDEVLP